MVCVSVALLSVMGTLGKHLGEIVSVVQIVFFRSLFALLPVSLALGRGASSMPGRLFRTSMCSTPAGLR